MGGAGTDQTLDIFEFVQNCPKSAVGPWGALGALGALWGPYGGPAGGPLFHPPLLAPIGPC